MKGPDRVLASLNILRMLSEKRKFQKWLREYHGIKYVDHKIFTGYHLFLRASLVMLMSAIEMDYSLGLKEDEVFFRAWFAGIPLDDVPATCQKIVFMKNLWSITKPLRKAKSWKDIKHRHFRTLNNLFDKIYSRSKVIIKGLDKETGLEFITKFYVYINLNDTSHGGPKALFSSSLIDVPKSIRGLRKAFLGYTLALEYIWYRIIGKDLFDNSFLSKLHEIDVLEKDDTSKWSRLDDYFGEIGKNYISPFEKRYRINVMEPIFKLSRFDKRLLGRLLSKKKVKQPEYFIDPYKDKKTLWKYLDYKLLWYGLEVLSSTQSIFSGVPAFIPTLLGLAQYMKDKIYVKVFKHPVDEHGYDYSFGLLIPAAGTITDYSGWLIFYDVATDHSGFGGTLYKHAMVAIQALRKRGKVVVDEIIVDSKSFREYLEERSVSSVFGTIRSLKYGKVNINDIVKFINSVRGIMFEFLVYKWLIYNIRMNDYVNVFHNITINDEEIDILVEKRELVELYECKVNVTERNVNEIIRKLKQKILRVSSHEKYKNKKIKTSLVVYYPLKQKIREKIETSNINVLDNFRRVLLNRETQILTKDKISLVKRILDYLFR